MAEEKYIKQAKLSDYLTILYKWRKLLFINMFLIITLATVYSFLVPEQFKATSIVMVSQENNSMGGISSLISGSGLGAFGSQLFDMSSPSQDIIFGILNSRTALTYIINKFGLIEYYGISDNNMDKTLKSFRRNLIFEPTENDLIEISVINEDPKLSAEIANYFVHLADSINIELNIEQARNNRIFVEKRYLKNVTDLRAAEDSMYDFQKNYGIFAVPEQLEASLKAAAEIEAQLFEQQLLVDLLKQQYGENSPLYSQMNEQLNFLKRKVKELKNSSQLSFPSNVIFPFAKVPELIIKYFRIFREIEIQTKIMEFVLPMYEQAMVEEQKSIPSLIVVDKAVPPQLKNSPKKALIILAAFFLGLFFHIVFLFRADYALENPIKRNPVEEKEANFSNWVKRFYRIKQ